MSRSLAQNRLSNGLRKGGAPGLEIAVGCAVEQRQVVAVDEQVVFGAVGQLGPDWDEYARPRSETR